MKIILSVLIILFLFGCISLNNQGNIKEESNNSLDMEYCPVCGAKLFDAVPGLTTKEDIIEFAKNSNLDENVKKHLIEDAWIHPGLYCPNGYYEVLISYEY